MRATPCSPWARSRCSLPRPPGQTRTLGHPRSRHQWRHTGQPERWRETGKLPASADEKPPRHMGLIRITAPEARRLFADKISTESMPPGKKPELWHGPDINP